MAVGIVFLNKGSSTIRQLEMNILDTINMRLLRDEGKSSMVSNSWASCGRVSNGVITFEGSPLRSSVDIRGSSWHNPVHWKNSILQHLLPIVRKKNLLAAY